MNVTVKQLREIERWHKARQSLGSFKALTDRIRVNPNTARYWISKLLRTPS